MKRRSTRVPQMLTAESVYEFTFRIRDIVLELPCMQDRTQCSLAFTCEASAVSSLRNFTNPSSLTEQGGHSVTPEMQGVIDVLKKTSTQGVSAVGRSEQPGMSLEVSKAKAFNSQSK